MPPRIRLHSSRNVFAPGERIRPELIVANETATPLNLPLLDGQGHPAVRLLVTLPGADRPLELGLPDDLGGAPAPTDGTYEILAPEQDRSRTIALSDAVDLRARGQYVLQAAIGSGPDRIYSNKLMWYREGPGALGVAIPAHRGRHDVSRCLYLAPGEYMTGLFRAELEWEQELRPDQVTVRPATFLARLGTHARGLTALAGTEPTLKSTDEWFAWLDRNRIHGALDWYGFQETHGALPFEPGRIVREMIPTRDGGCGVLVAGADHLSVAFVRFERPDEGDARMRLMAEEEDEEPPPEPVQPRVVWTHTFDRPFAGCAFACGVGAHPDLRGLAVSVPASGGVEVEYAVFEGDDPPARFGTLLVGEGEALPRCDPALAFDTAGRAHVVVLLQGSGPPGQEDRVLVARTSFDRDARPRLDRNTVYHEDAVLSGRPTAGIVSVLTNDAGGPWVIDWCVLLEGNRLLASRRSGEARMLNPDAVVVQPLTLLTIPERSFVAACTDEGTLTFVDCG